MKAEVVAPWFEKQLLSKILEHPNENTCDISLIATCRHTSYNCITKKTLRKMIFKIDISVEDYRGPFKTLSNVFDEAFSVSGKVPTLSAWLMCLKRSSVSWIKNSSVALVSVHLRQRKTKEDPLSIIFVASYTLVTRRSNIPKKKILWRTVAWKCSVKKAFLNFLQNTQEKGCVRVYLK